MIIKETSDWDGTSGTGRSFSNSKNIVQYGKSTPVDVYGPYIEEFIKGELNDTPFTNNMNGKKTYSIFTYIELKFGKDASSVDNKDKNVHKRRLTVYIETKNLIGHYEDNTTIFKNKVNNAIKGGFAKYNETYSEKIKIADSELYDVEIGSNFIKLYYNVTDEQYVNQEKKQIIRIVKHNNRYINESEIRMVKDFYREHMSMFLENKDRFIDKNSNLDPMQKQIAKDFFKNHPDSESKVD